MASVLSMVGSTSWRGSGIDLGVDKRDRQTLRFLPGTVSGSTLAL